MAQTLTIFSSDNVQMLLTDSVGRMVGFDKKSGRVRQELPECGYGLTGVGDVGVPVGKQTNDQAYELWIAGPPYGIFSLKVIGEYTGAYSLRIHQGGVAPAHLKTERYIFKGYEQEFTLILSAATKPTVEKKTDPGSFRQDLDNCYSSLLLGDKELYKDLSRRLDKLDKYLSDKDSSKARHELEKFQEKIDQVRKETVKTEQKKAKPPKHFISKDAYDILTEDVTLLLKQLPIDKKGKGGKQSNRLQQKS